jgi:hypothetical protein
MHVANVSEKPNIPQGWYENPLFHGQSERSVWCFLAPRYTFEECGNNETEGWGWRCPSFVKQGAFVPCEYIFNFYLIYIGVSHWKEHFYDSSHSFKWDSKVLELSLYNMLEAYVVEQRYAAFFV